MAQRPGPRSATVQRGHLNGLILFTSAFYYDILRVV